MASIERIKEFTKDFKSIYGIDSNGSCYLVKKEFILEIVSSYEIENLDPETMKPYWSKIKCLEGDLISAANNTAFLQLKGYEGFVECRPEIRSKEGEPKFDRFQNDLIEKIGKNMIDSKPMTFEERKRVIIDRR